MLAEVMNNEDKLTLEMACRDLACVMQHTDDSGVPARNISSA